MEPKNDRPLSTQGDCDITHLLASISEGTITNAEKQQLEVGARMREIIKVCQSLVEDVSASVDKLLETCPEELHQSEINLIDHLTTLDAHLAEANDLTKQNFNVDFHVTTFQDIVNAVSVFCD